ncbi:ATP-binding cassette domain-containing protein [bacterium]|nr:MAG: ATP-binding cassette domain-containing protein [bacterium]
MIELFHIWKQYQKPFWVLSDVSLQIKDGDFYFITGPSGSGKTTLLKAIFRETLPTERQILINGVNILKIHDSRIYTLRRRMGIVFQDFRLMFHRTVFENVAVPLQVIGVARKEIRRRVFNTLQKDQFGDLGVTVVFHPQVNEVLFCRCHEKRPGRIPLPAPFLDNFPERSKISFPADVPPGKRDRGFPNGSYGSAPRFEEDDADVRPGFLLERYGFGHHLSHLAAVRDAGSQG